MSVWSVGMLVSAVGWADEGMWTPDQVPAMADKLEEMGLRLPAAALGDPQAAPLSAIVSLGGCSASFVSPNGLLATNHHCVEGYLQVNSTAEADRARDGYTAPDRAGELPAGPSARVYVIERIDDVTDRVSAAVGRRMPDVQRKEAIDRARKAIVAECEVKAGRRCRVASFYEGLSYRLIVQKELQDLRLVYSPPRSVGSYGGEVDNWMWPRHTGDFALLRAYVAPDGSSAPYSADNVPYIPPHHLPLAVEGVGPGDFVMVAGFPGWTRRHDRASELRYAAEVRYPLRLEQTAELLAVLRDHSARDPEGAAKLASPILGLSNVDKNNRELLSLLSGSDIIVEKEDDEAALDAWIEAERSRRSCRRAITELEEVIDAQQLHSERTRASGSMVWIADLLGVTHRAYRFAVEAERPDLQRASGYQDRDRARAAARFQQLSDTLYLPADRDALAVVLRGYQEQPAPLRIPPLDAWLRQRGGAEAVLDALYDAPALAQAEARLALLEMDRAALEASDDPWVSLAVTIELWLAEQRVTSDRLQGAMLRLRPQVAEATLAMKGAAGMYPDANSTLRLTFGHVEGWSPADGVAYLPQTTLSGVVAKATGLPPFDAPASLLERAAQPSRWQDAALGDVPVNTLSTLDITGGNSGSATLNADGAFVGLAFDGNPDSIGADWVFGDTARTIHVDVRYLLWTLDGEPAAGWLLDELGVSR
jgi:hypothetical protein